MWPLIDGVMEALNDNESRWGGLLFVACYRYFDWELREYVKMNGVDVFEYWTVLDPVMEA